MDENSQTNRGRGHLDINAKLNILRRLDEGESGQMIANDLGCTKSTISRIKKARNIIENFSKSRNMNCKRIVPLRNDKLEAALLKYIAQASSSNIKISGPILQDKALHFAELLGIENFKASSGWLHAFKTRNDIRWNLPNTDIFGETNNDSTKILTEEEIIDSVKSECESNIRPSIVISPCSLCKINSAKLVSLANIDKQQNISNILIKNFPFLNLNTEVKICKECWRALHVFIDLSIKIQQAHNQITAIESTILEEKAIKMEDLSENIKIEPLDYLEWDIEENMKYTVQNEPIAADDSQQILEQLAVDEYFNHSRQNYQHDDKVDIDQKDTNSDKTKEGSNKFVMVYDKTIREFLDIICSFCGKEFETFGSMMKHAKEVHNEEGFIECCNKKYFKRWVLFNHVSHHLNPSHIWTCDLCQKTFRKKRGLKDHIITHHKNPEDRPYPCDECDKKYASRSLLNTHKNSHKEAIHKCPICGTLRTSQYQLKNHMVKHETKTSFICEICCKGFKRHGCLKEHMKCHTKEKKQCDICGVWVRCLRIHKQGHEKVLLNCNECEKTFESHAAKRAHVQYMHRRKRTLQCTYCDKTFKMLTNLREHITTHTGEVLYTCPYCPTTFNSNANMYRHRKLCAQKHENKK